MPDSSVDAFSWKSCRISLLWGAGSPSSQVPPPSDCPGGVPEAPCSDRESSGCWLQGACLTQPPPATTPRLRSAQQRQHGLHHAQRAPPSLSVAEPPSPQLSSLCLLRSGLWVPVARVGKLRLDQSVASQALASLVPARRQGSLGTCCRGDRPPPSGPGVPESRAGPWSWPSSQGTWRPQRLGSGPRPFGRRRG